MYFHNILLLFALIHGISSYHVSNRLYSRYHRIPTNLRTTTDNEPQTEANNITSSPSPSVVISEDDRILRQTALMLSLWQNVAFPTDAPEGVEFKLSDFGLTRRDVRGVLSHFQNCKDCAADNAFLIATQDNNNEDILKLTNVAFRIFSEEEDDDDEWGDYEGMFDDEDNGAGREEELKPIFPIETDDTIVLQDTQNWVRKVIADLGVCPFTINPNKAGIPLGGVKYTVSRTKNVDEAFLKFWEDVAALLVTPEKEMSTVLLVFPEIELFGNYELFESYCDSLNDALCASCLGMEAKLQLVFFHPKYQFRDGKARLTEDQSAGAANFARRSPWPMINILRTNQVRAAQKGIPTGQVYHQNEEKLSKVGTESLQKMLMERNWDALPSYSTLGKQLLAKEQQQQQQQGIVGAVESGGNDSTAAGGTGGGTCPFTGGNTII